MTSSMGGRLCLPPVIMFTFVYVHPQMGGKCSCIVYDRIRIRRVFNRRRRSSDKTVAPIGTHSTQSTTLSPNCSLVMEPIQEHPYVFDDIYDNINLRAKFLLFLKKRGASQHLLFITRIHESKDRNDKVMEWSGSNKEVQDWYLRTKDGFEMGLDKQKMGRDSKGKRRYSSGDFIAAYNSVILLQKEYWEDFVAELLNGSFCME